MWRREMGPIVFPDCSISSSRGTRHKSFLFAKEIVAVEVSLLGKQVSCLHIHSKVRILDLSLRQWWAGLGLEVALALLGSKGAGDAAPS